jgi:hypothetical protein
MDYNNCGCVKGICFQLAFFFQLAYQILLHFTVNLGNKMRLDSRVVGKAVELCMQFSFKVGRSLVRLHFQKMRETFGGCQ